VTALTMGAIFANVAGSPFVLQGQFGLTEQQFAVAFGAGALGLIIATQVNVRLLRRYPPQQIAVTALVAASVAALALVGFAATGAGGLAGILVPLFLALMAAGLVMPNAPAVAMSRHGEAAGTAGAVLGAVQFGLAALTAPMVGVLGSGALAMAAVIAGAMLSPTVIMLLVVAARGRSRPATAAPATSCAARHHRPGALPGTRQRPPATLGSSPAGQTGPAQRRRQRGVRRRVPPVARTSTARPSVTTHLVVEAQGERDPRPDRIHLPPRDLHHVARLDHVARVLDVTARHRRDVYQAVLVDSDVDEGAERRDVGDHTLQHHPRAQVGERVHTLGEGRGAKRRPGVAAGLVEFGEDVGDGGQAEPLVHEVLGGQRTQQPGVADQVTDRTAGRRPDPADHRVRLGVHRGSVQRVLPAGDPQKPRTLLERLGP